jgi:pimeloyl-ACP methyl ester carboxylesterase
MWSSVLSQAMLQQFGKSAAWWAGGRRWGPGEFEASGWDRDLERYVAFMDELGIDKAVIIGLACAPFAAKTPAEFTAAAVQRYPDRFIAYAALDPIGYRDHSPAGGPWSFPDTRGISA